MEKKMLRMQAEKAEEVNNGIGRGGSLTGGGVSVGSHEDIEGVTHERTWGKSELLGLPFLDRCRTE